MPKAEVFLVLARTANATRRSFLSKPFIKRFRELTNDTLARLSEQ